MARFIISATNTAMPVTKLKVTGSVGKRQTGTRVRFLPDPSYFDTTQILLPRLKHLLRAKAVLCPGLRVTLAVHRGGKVESDEWIYEAGLAGYLLQETGRCGDDSGPTILLRRTG